VLDGQHNFIHMVLNISRWESENFVAISRHPHIPHQIFRDLRGKIMMSSINFYDEHGSAAEKISDIRTNVGLPTKCKTDFPESFQFSPQQTFFIRHISS